MLWFGHKNTNNKNNKWLLDINSVGYLNKVYTDSVEFYPSPNED